MTDEIERCAALGIPFLVHHPGSHVGTDLETGLANIAKAYKELFARTKGVAVVSCFEGTVGAGNLIGGPFEHLSLLLAAAPLMLAIWIAIKRTSSGPALFKQDRYGLDGERIVVYKFRTMRCEDNGPRIVQATRSDPRVTPVGRFLRRTSLDELPQLINVLQGRMSIVGPRPHAVAHNEQYRRLISGYMVRHKVVPGITGLAQVNGCRGETATLEDMEQRVGYDLEYLRHWCLLLDIKIMFKTLALVIRDKHAY
jgi:putative colanic acid biosynthesis UDP-glucose lipid carrier transferase